MLESKYWNHIMPKQKNTPKQGWCVNKRSRSFYCCAIYQLFDWFNVEQS